MALTVGFDDGNALMTRMSFNCIAAVVTSYLTSTGNVSYWNLHSSSGDTANDRGSGILCQRSVLRLQTRPFG